MPILFDSGPRIREEEFRLIRDHINRYCGITLGPDGGALMERKLRDRLHALGHSSFAEYYQYLRYSSDGPAEVERAVDHLTTNETYFFREEYQLTAFAQELLPAIVRQRRPSENKRLSIWSAGCSTGEEVYSLAILIADSGLFADWDVHVFGSDISKRVLRIARRAVYGPSSFRAMPRRYGRYFVDGPEGKTVSSRIRAMCHFGQLNLLDRDRLAIVGRVDAVFCRNVLIYFDPSSRRRVIEAFYERIVPGGYLLLGHSESLIHLSTAFELVHLTTDLVYRRPVSGGASIIPRGQR